MNREEILKIINEVMDDYELGSDSHRLYIKNNILTYCSTTYEWYNIELKDDTPQELLKSIITLLMDWIFEINEYKELKKG